MLALVPLAALFALACTAPVDASAQRDCRLAGTLEAYAFIAARPLTRGETALVTREVEQHAGEASPDDCDKLDKLRALIATDDPVLRERRRVVMHAAIWFDPATGAARKATLQRIAPVIVADDELKLIVRRRAVEAFLASIRFMAGQLRIDAPSDTIDKHVAETAAAFPGAGETVKRIAADQEAYYILLRRDWSRKDAGWQQHVLGGRPTTALELETSTAKAQLALAGGGEGRRYPWQDRLDRFLDASNRGMVSGAVTSAMNAGRP